MMAFNRLLLLVSLVVIISAKVKSSYGKLERIEVGDGKTLRVGIISDSQLNAYETDEDMTFTEHLERSLEILKEQKIEVLMYAGDLGNRGTEFAFQTFMNLLKKVFGDNPPILDIIMGNHDYIRKPKNVHYQRGLFEKIIGEKPMGHKVINGFHFINWGSLGEWVNYVNSNRRWAKKEIKLAIEEDSTKPIFVLTHYAPKNTMYGSIEWGTRDITQVLKKYPQVISFSGHSHYSLLDERSIWQREFTAIQTQSTSYIELESGKENGSVPHDEFGDTKIASKHYMGLIMDINEKEVRIQRISLEKNQSVKEPWIIDIPVVPESFRYCDNERISKAIPPHFEGDKSIKLIQANSTLYQIHFKQALHDDLVHSYRIVITPEDSKKPIEYLYFSDFYLMKEDRKEYITLKLPELKQGIKYHLNIYAIESFGKESQEGIEGDIILPTNPTEDFLSFLA